MRRTTRRATRLRWQSCLLEGDSTWHTRGCFFLQETPFTFETYLPAGVVKTSKCTDVCVSRAGLDRASPKESPRLDYGASGTRAGREAAETLQDGSRQWVRRELVRCVIRCVVSCVLCYHGSGHVSDGRSLLLFVDGERAERARTGGREDDAAPGPGGESDNGREVENGHGFEALLKAPCGNEAAFVQLRFA